MEQFYGACFFFLYLDRPLSLYEEQCEHFSKRLLSNFTKERKSNGFGMTSGVWMMTFFVIPLINASDIAWLIRICCSKTCFYNHKQHFWDISEKWCDTFKVHVQFHPKQMNMNQYFIKLVVVCISVSGTKSFEKVKSCLKNNVAPTLNPPLKPTDSVNKR